MEGSLRIAVADDEQLMLRWYQETLESLGHSVVVSVANGDDLVLGCQVHHPDLVITDIRMPGRDGIDAAAKLRQGEPVPVILVTAHHDHESVQRALEHQVLAYLIKPIKRPDLETAILLVMRRFREFQALRKHAQDLTQALEDRKMIERAKGILMRRGGMAEPDAFRRLQKLSQEKNLKLVDVARTILAAEEAFSV